MTNTIEEIRQYIIDKYTDKPAIQEIKDRLEYHKTIPEYRIHERIDNANTIRSLQKSLRNDKAQAQRELYRIIMKNQGVIYS